MLNPYNMTFQPFFIIQAPTATFPSFIFQQNPAFLYQQFIHPNALQNGISLSENPISQGQTTQGATPRPIEAENKEESPNGSQILTDRSIIKEKIIKKPANRPATYLTERKYYLAQTLQAEPDLNRKLRPRNLKRRSQKASEKSHHNNQDSLKLKQKNELSRDDPSSSENFQTCQKKKAEDKSSSMFEKEIKSNESSTSRDDSK